MLLDRERQGLFVRGGVERSLGETVVQSVQRLLSLSERFNQARAAGLPSDLFCRDSRALPSVTDVEEHALDLGTLKLSHGLQTRRNLGWKASTTDRPRAISARFRRTDHCSL